MNLSALMHIIITITEKKNIIICILTYTRLYINTTRKFVL